MSNKTQILSVIAVLLGTWLLGVSGMTRLPDALLYDWYVGSTPEIDTALLDIVVVEIDHKMRRGQKRKWNLLLERLEAQAPRWVIFNFIPESAPDDFYKTAAGYGNVIFGRRAAPNPLKRNRLEPEPTPEAFQSEAFPTGIVLLPPVYYGVHRYQRTGLMIDETFYPSLEAVAANRVAGIDEDPWTPGLFRVNFNGKTNGFPKTTADRILSGDLFSGQIRDKIVIVGFAESYYDIGVHTPVTPESSISMPEFNAHALDTLIHDKLIVEPSPQLTGLILLLIIFIGVLIYRISSFQFFSWLMIPSALLFLLAAWKLFVYFNVWLPLSQILAAHFLIFLYLCRNFTVSHEKSTQEMLVKTSAKLQDRVLPESFYEIKEHWDQVVVMVNQTLNLSRTIFLEKIPGDQRIREVKALNCTLSDIHEKRRDYRRTPYSNAIKENRPIRLKKYSFLKHPHKDEEQYLVPLMFGGRVLGFWFLGVESANISKMDDFQFRIVHYADQISELLYRRELRMRQNRIEKRRIRRYLKLLPESDVYRELNSSITLLERRLTLLEKVFDGIGASVILYDLFGRVLHANRNMAELMETSGFLIYQMTASDFLSAVTNLTLEDIRSLIRNTIFDRKPFTLTATLESAPGKTFMINIRPVTQTESDSSSINEAAPFRTIGVLIELVEVTELDMLNRLKDELYNKVSHTLYKDFQPLVLACDLLKIDTITSEDRKTAFETLERRIRQMAEFVKKAGEDLSESIYIGKETAYPIDPALTLKPALAALSIQAEQKKVSFDIEIAESVSMVRAGPESFMEVMKTFLTVLINDAVQNTRIKISILEMDETVIFNFSNKGYGMPDDVFKSYLSGTSEVASPDIKALRQAISRLRRWGGVIDASSKLGDGIRFAVYMKPDTYSSKQGTVKRFRADL